MYIDAIHKALSDGLYATANNPDVPGLSWGTNWVGNSPDGKAIVRITNLSDTSEVFVVTIEREVK